MGILADRVGRGTRMVPSDAQATLFGTAGTVHEALVTAGGPRALVNAANKFTALSERPGSLPRTLAGRNGRLIADTAAAAAIRDSDGLYEKGYSYSAWCLAGLPHREPPKDGNWLIETDFARLLVRPGVRLRDDGTQEMIGVPFGSFARLLLLELQSEALERGSREIRLERTASALLARLHIARGGPGAAKVAEQLERLATCSLDFSFGSDRRGVVFNQRLVEAFEFVGEPAGGRRGNLRLVERLILSEAFYNELRAHPVPVDRAAVRDLASSPLAIDVYLWLAFRLHALQDETEVGWDRLWRQFGTKVGKLKNFKAHFEAPLHLALSAYPAARVTVSDRGMLMRRSPPPVSG